MNTDQPDDKLPPEYRPEDIWDRVRGRYLDQYRAGTSFALLAQRPRRLSTGEVPVYFCMQDATYDEQCQC